MAGRKLNLEEQKFLEALFEKNKLKLVKLLSSSAYYKGSDEAEDLISEVAIIACEKIDSVMNHPNPDAWLLTTARMVALNACGKAASRRKNCVSIEEDMQLSDHASEDKMIEEIIYRNMSESRMIEKVFTALSPREIELYKMFYVAGMSIDEIAEKKDRTYSAVATDLSRMRHHVRDIIENPDFFGI